MVKKVIVILNYVNKRYLAAIASKLHPKHESLSIPKEEFLYSEHKTDILRMIHALIEGYKLEKEQVIQQVCGPLDADPRTDPKILVSWEVDERMYSAFQMFEKKIQKSIKKKTLLSMNERKMIHLITYCLAQLAHTTPAGKKAEMKIPLKNKKQKMFEEVS